jgi:hypothetical protein
LCQAGIREGLRASRGLQVVETQEPLYCTVLPRPGRVKLRHYSAVKEALCIADILMFDPHGARRMTCQPWLPPAFSARTPGSVSADCQRQELPPGVQGLSLSGHSPLPSVLSALNKQPPLPGATSNATASQHARTLLNGRTHVSSFLVSQAADRRREGFKKNMRNSESPKPYQKPINPSDTSCVMRMMMYTPKKELLRSKHRLRGFGTPRVFVAHDHVGSYDEAEGSPAR